ncbi:MAG: RNA-directed DNA polymerase [Candidatus Accumulibacter sp.]|jgi:retron-type reverse transcriptase|nr:RNA-directed DNA polymerase [Accumulibacter sp.]
MKRHGNLFEQTFSREALFDAYLKARRGKRSRRSCFWFDTHAGAAIEALHRRIHDGTYAPREYRTFVVRTPKMREIRAPWFDDIVVQHAVYAVIRPIFDRTFIDQSYACRIGKGTHKASDYTMKALQESRPDSYTLKIDVRKFFYSIDRAILRGLVERKIKDKRLVDITMSFADLPEPLGIPIGNLLSQLFALIYLNPLDHFIKRTLKVRRYCRYVDDGVLFDLTREECLTYKARIEAFLRNELHLELSKWTIAKTARGVNFVGYRTWRRVRVIRKYSLYKFRRAAKEGRIDSVISLLGHAKDTHSLGYMWKTIRDVNPDLVEKLPPKVRKFYPVSMPER